MAQIYETKNFIVEAYEKPFVARTDGGHIRIKVKDEDIFDRTKLSPLQTVELVRLTMVIISKSISTKQLLILLSSSLCLESKMTQC